MAGKYLSLLVHFVWSTKNREPWIARDWSDNLYAYIGGVLRKKKAKLICAGGIDDHIHIYSSLPSTLTVADAVNAMKAYSSRWVHEEIPKKKGFAWQDGYGAFSVNKSSEQRVIDYILNQEAHHRRYSFQSEFLTLLRKHEIEYDERYLWR
jgi:REP element-mobilizing transposase RayT